MKIDFEDEDLKELIETGHNKKYKKFSKVKYLMNGLLRAYRIMDVSPNVSMLCQFSFLKYELDKKEITKRNKQPETFTVTIPAHDHNLFRDLIRKMGWACAF